MDDHFNKRSAFLLTLQAQKAAREPKKIVLTANPAPTYAQVVKRENPSSKPFGIIIGLSLWLPNFKEIVFKLLEEYHFEVCTAFPLLLQKWKKYNPDRPVDLSAFLNRTEPKINKLPFYKAAFEHLDNLHLAEFLAEAIEHGELDYDFINSLENAA